MSQVKSQVTNQKAKRGKLKWIIGVLVVLIIGGVGFRQWKKSGKSQIVYRPMKVNRGDIKTTILATGSVAPENRLDLKPQVAGRVEKVLVQEGDRVKAGQVLAWLSSTERAALIDAALSEGKKEVDYWEDAYKMSPVLAPKNGLIILKNADAGQSVTPTDIVLSMSDRLIVKANVDETDLAQIKNGQRVSLILDAFPAAPMPAKVLHIGFDAKTVNNVTTYEVDVIADKTPAYMKSGMTANATFLVAEKDDAIVVPAAAVHRHEKESYVLVPNPEEGGPAIEKPIEVGLSDGKKVEVISGLNEGDTILLASLSSFGKEDKGSSPFSPFGNNRPPKR